MRGRAHQYMCGMYIRISFRFRRLRLRGGASTPQVAGIGSSANAPFLKTYWTLSIHQWTWSYGGLNVWPDGSERPCFPETLSHTLRIWSPRLALRYLPPVLQNRSARAGPLNRWWTSTHGWFNAAGKRSTPHPYLCQQNSGLSRARS